MLDDELKVLIAAGYKQTSAKYGIVTQLPRGLSGAEALQAVAPDVYEDFKRNFEAQCASQYLRVYAPKEDRIELTPEELRRFRALGGDVA